MTTSETKEDYSLDISIIRTLSLDGTARTKRSYSYKNLRATSLAFDFPISFELAEEHAQPSVVAHTSDGVDLPITTSIDGKWMKISATPSTTISPGATWSVEFEFTISDKAVYAQDRWVCHESWEFSEGLPNAGGLKESQPRSYHYSARVLDGRFKLFGLPVLLETMAVSSHPEMEVTSAKGYKELSRDFNVSKGRVVEITVLYATRPWAHRARVVTAALTIAITILALATGIILLPI